MNKAVITVSVVVLALLIRTIWVRHGTLSIDDVLRDVGATDLAREKADEYKQPEVIKVADGVYVAVNYAVANSILLEGDDGKVIVDTTESLDAGKEIAAEFNKITQKETKAIIYTHHHADHITGTRAFLRDGQTDVPIWAHRLYEKEMNRIYMKGQAHQRRGLSQVGGYIDDYRLSVGLGGKFRTGSLERIQPTHIMDEDMDLTVAGINMRLIHIPGESSDQIGVWLPDKRILLCADDLYKAFPNLYAIRGVTPRDVMDWAESLDKMRQLRPQCLVGSHCKPVCGEQEVYDLLSTYMYGIQYVHDQTVRYINKGVHPDEIAKLVKLPEELARHPYLVEHYGTIHWSVKAVYIMYLGWFSGHAVDLDPLTPSAKAERMLKLVGKKQLLRAAEAALSESDYQWALELATHIHRLEPDNSWAKQLRKDSMTKLAEQQISAPGRNYYMTEMIQDEGLVPKSDMKKFIGNFQIQHIFRGLRSRLMADELPPGEDINGCFQFTDTGLFVSARIHHGILEVTYKEPEECAFKLITTEQEFKELITQSKSSIGSYMFGDLKVEGALLNIRRFLNYFDRDI